MSEMNRVSFGANPHAFLLFQVFNLAGGNGDRQIIYYTNVANVNIHCKAIFNISYLDNVVFIFKGHQQALIYNFQGSDKGKSEFWASKLVSAAVYACYFL